jgi:hypothetical protein
VPLPKRVIASDTLSFPVLASPFLYLELPTIHPLCPAC